MAVSSMRLLLSHYTDREGLEGIAETGTLRATDFLYLKDTSEFFYGFRHINEVAQEMVMELIPAEKKRTTYDIKSAFDNAANQLKQSLRSTNGYGHLYVTSFARGKTEDEDKRGIRTLWELYAGHNHSGYCLQFDQDDVQRMLRLEAERCNYQQVGMHEVKYGADKDERDFQDLCFQLAQQILVQIFDARPDIHVEPEWEQMWPSGEFHSKLMRYCATHKDPCFVDEREVRIFAYPSPSADPRVFTGTAAKKRVRMPSPGKRYIVLGENWKPGIVPRRVIIGTKANRDVASVLARCSPAPEVTFADMPVA